MTDFADEASKYEEEDRLRAITEAARGVRHMQGPPTCVECKETNDRRAAGYATCSGCLEEMEE